MVHNARPIGKPDAPGRSRRARTQTSTSGSKTTDVPPVVASEEPRPTKPPKKRLAFTRRALVLLVLAVMLAGSYVGSLRTLMMQQQQRAVAEQQIISHTARISQLESDLQRWRDPAFVKAQARSRLGWAMPGEVGYRVIGTDGQVITDSISVDGVGGYSEPKAGIPWWETVERSISIADQPQVAPTPEP